MMAATARAYRRHARRLRGDRGYWWYRGQLALGFLEPQGEPIDKSDWGDGPWQNEPDFLRWQDYATGLWCVVRRALSTGALCGYVALPKGHPFRRMSGLELPVEAHGGVTYSEQMGADFYIGFDCAHYQDLMPYLRAQLSRTGFTGQVLELGSYRDLEFAIRQCERVAAQVRAA